jgi:hypothetical protein
MGCPHARAFFSKEASISSYTQCHHIMHHKYKRPTLKRRDILRWYLVHLQSCVVQISISSVRPSKDTVRPPFFYANQEYVLGVQDHNYSRTPEDKASDAEKGKSLKA